MKIVTWNVNGLRACIKNGFFDAFKKLDADVFCIQETKLQTNQIPNEIISDENFKIRFNKEKKGITDLTLKNNFLSIKTDSLNNSFWHFSIKKGYSGVAIFSKKDVLNVTYGIGDDLIDSEGRTITLEYKDFYIVNAYVPNAQPGLKRIDFRMMYEEKMLKYFKKLEKKKPIIYLGDMNVARSELDLKNPKQNEGEPGYSFEEREKMEKLLENGFIDVFREKYKDKIIYTWWSYRKNARENNVGWRIDYFIVSKKIYERVGDIIIHNEIMGSDHCPVELIIK